MSKIQTQILHRPTQPCRSYLYTGANMEYLLCFKTH